jgi:hypothetical protein
MARRAVLLLLAARTLSIVLAILSLKAFSYDDDSSFGVHSTTIGWVICFYFQFLRSFP